MTKEVKGRNDKLAAILKNGGNALINQAKSLIVSGARRAFKAEAVAKNNPMIKDG